MQSKYWVFTWNNPSETCEQFSETLSSLNDFQYFSFQREAGENGTPHYQGYLEFTKPKRVSQLKHVNRAIHWETRRGTQEEAIAYTQKTDSRLEGPWTRGEPTPNRQGKRSDLEHAVDTLRTRGYSALVSDHPTTYVKYHKGFDALAAACKPAEKNVPECVLLYGPPGTGKTRTFYDTFQDPSNRWVQPITNTTTIWFDGYRGQEAALFDDFDGKRSHFTLNTLLRITDRYELQAPVKGNHVWFNPKYIYFTTNYHPRDWYDWNEREQQYPGLVRRFTKVIWYKSIDALPIHLNRPDMGGEADHWEHFWRGAAGAQLQLDRLTGTLVSHAPADKYNF